MSYLRSPQPLLWMTMFTVLCSAVPRATSADVDSAESEASRESSEGDKGTFGLGLILGEPSGISARLYVANDAALQASLGAAFVGRGIQMTADYVVHPWILENQTAFVVPAYVGAGARLIQYSREADEDRQRSVAIGARGVAGLLFDFRDVPLDAFAEVAGVVELEFRDGARLGLGLNVAIGGRYYF